MTRIAIMEEKVNKVVDKLEKVKECISSIIEDMEESVEDIDNDSEEEEWDDEYEIKRRRGNRPGYSKSSHKSTRERETSRY